MSEWRVKFLREVIAHWRRELSFPGLGCDRVRAKQQLSKATRELEKELEATQ